VTIVRNNECFALLSREKLSEIVTEASHADEVLEIIYAAFLTLRGVPPTAGSCYGWLSAFDTDEVQELVTEVLGAYRNAPLVAEGWDELEAIIHEWHESAIAILSDDLAAAFVDDAEEVILSAPAKPTHYQKSA
jgi:hypothetical protein